MSGDTLYIIGALVATALLIAGNALFVFHEFAFVVLKPGQVRRLERGYRRVGQYVARAAHHLDHYIAVDQLGITATSLAVGWIGQPVVSDLFASPLRALGAPGGTATVIGFIVAYVIITAVQMVCGELMPKTVALRHPERVAALVTLPVEATARVLHPLVWALNGLGNATVRLFGMTPQTESHGQVLPAEELEVVIRTSARAGALKADPDVLRRALRFSDLEARDVIVPRQDVAMLDMRADIDEVLEIAREARHTRYPVYVDTPDNVVGLLNVKDLIQIQPDGRPVLASDWQELVRPIPALPEVASIEQVLATLSREQQQMALLLDEYGGTAGILTVTDIAARLIAGDRDIRHIGEGRYVIAGDASIDEVESTLGLELVDEEHDVETLGGLVMAELERVPNVGDEVMAGHARLRVATMRGRRVMQVVLDVPPDAQSEIDTSDSEA